MMQKPERSEYTALDFNEWKEAGALVLSPKFQRRPVWTTPARSYLIDSILMGMPVPPIYIRVIHDRTKRRPIREIIDGQQRLSAILTYLDDGFALSKSLDSEFAGKKFSHLPSEAKDQILQYPFICELFHGIDDAKVLQIFARLNTYSVKLNAQELRNGKYFGQFKRSAYTLAFEHLEFWRENRVFSETNIARMAEVELTSELMILSLAGLQDKKKSIDDFYENYDESFRDRVAIEKQFRDVLDEIQEACGDTLKESAFRRPPMFYSLYAVVYHRMYGLAGESLPTQKRKRLSATERDGIETAVRKLSRFISDAKQGEDVPRAYDNFVTASLRQTDNIKPRRARFEKLYRESFL